MALYARVSTADQSSQLQLRELRRHARVRGFTIYQEYVDQVTGNVAKRRADSAPAYDQLLQDAQRRRFDIVLVWKYDRFARSMRHLVEALEQFHTLGVEFISLTEQVDTTTPQGKLFFAIVAGFAEYERSLIVERVRAGLANARRAGKTLGRPRDLAVEAKVRKLRSGGQSISAIARAVDRSRAGVLKILGRQAQHEKRSRAGH